MTQENNNGRRSKAAGMPASAAGWLGRATRRGAAGEPAPRRFDRGLARPARARGRSPGTTTGFIATRLRWMVLVTLVVIAGAAMLSWSRTATYRASAEVLVQPRMFSDATAPQVPDMGTEKAVASSGVVLEIAARSLGVLPNELSRGLTVGVPLNTHVLHIAYASPTPAEAQRRAQALAEAYVSYWVAQQPAVRSVNQKAGSSGVDVAKSAVITPAARPTSPASPNHVVDVSIATIIGLMLAVGTALIRDRLDDHLRGPSDFEVNGGGPVLALVPAVRHSRKDVPGKLVMVRAPESPSADAYRDLRTRVFRAAALLSARTLLVTRPVGEDRSAVAANLAVALAKSGQRVVLVCGDLRFPRGHELFGMENDPGLASVLDGRADLTKALRATDIPGLQLLTAGCLVGDFDAVMHAPALRRVLGQLRRGADFLVIDAPPVLAGADAVAVAELAEMILLVADARRTTRRQVHAAAAQLEHVSPNRIGCVLANIGRRDRLPKPPLSLVATTHVAADTLSQQDAGGPAEWLVTDVGTREATQG